VLFRSRLVQSYKQNQNESLADLQKAMKQAWEGQAIYQVKSSNNKSKDSQFVLDQIKKLDTSLGKKLADLINGSKKCSDIKKFQEEMAVLLREYILAYLDEKLDKKEFPDGPLLKGLSKKRKAELITEAKATGPAGMASYDALAILSELLNVNLGINSERAYPGKGTVLCTANNNPETKCDIVVHNHGGAHWTAEVDGKKIETSGHDLNCGYNAIALSLLGLCNLTLLNDYKPVYLDPVVAASSTKNSPASSLGTSSASDSTIKTSKSSAPKTPMPFVKIQEEWKSKKEITAILAVNSLGSKFEIFCDNKNKDNVNHGFSIMEKQSPVVGSSAVPPVPKALIEFTPNDDTAVIKGKHWPNDATDEDKIRLLIAGFLASGVSKTIPRVIQGGTIEFRKKLRAELTKPEHGYAVEPERPASEMFKSAPPAAVAPAVTSSPVLTR
jgi:hypothetical protein